MSKTKVNVDNVHIDDSQDRFLQYKLDHPNWYHVVPEDASIFTKMAAIPRHIANYKRRVIEQFGWHFVIMLISTYLFVKGFLYQLLDAGTQPLFISMLKVSSVDFSIYVMIAATPWSMKALMGLVSDTMPIRGYSKKYYIILWGFLSLIGYGILGSWSIPVEMSYIAPILFFIGHFEIALVDLLVEGRYAELMVKHPESSSDLVTIVWTTYHIGSLAATWVVGPMTDSFKATKNAWYIKGMFLAACPFAFQIVIPTFLNYLGEVPLPSNLRGFQSDKWNKHRKVFILAICMGFGALSMACFSLLNKLVFVKKFGIPPVHAQLPNLCYAVCLITFMVCVSYWALPRAVANALIFKFLGPATYMSLAGPLNNFYTGTVDCTGPNGPHFSGQYYISISGSVQAVFGFLGVSLFQAVMSEWEFRPCFWVSTILQVVAGTVDIIMVKRWNLAAGIPDKWMFMIGNNMIYTIVDMLHFMPGVVLISKMCPKGLESTLYALLAGFSNFGSNIAKITGAYAQPLLGISMAEEGPCTYDNLALLILIGHILLPLITIPATFVLLPKARLTDPLFAEELHTAFTGEEDEVEIALEDSSVAMEKKN